MALLLAHGWPGNVRELRNVVERAITIAEGDAIGIDELPDSIRGVTQATHTETAIVMRTANRSEREPRGLRALLRDHEARLIHEALARTGGNQRQAAELLEVPLRTLERKLASLSQRAS
jgi:DNA-binding NtrC family response regulator